ncbi:hypothetical protein [Hamadaea tsunoensis]|uniref:hypothetical protein n=1 Tax=Hamadaea tsunoensis TaxID=53368 RepID=UPI0004865755|nr:hypothetical protein [Hamadaea tsunoensis]
MRAMVNSLTETEQLLVRETETDQLTELDEDGLADLHLRVRRARDKYVKLYRREAASKVSEYGGRGKALPKNTRNLMKAEVFEDALARVSRSLAAAARAAATELRRERIALAAAARNTAPPRPTRSSGPGRMKSQAPRKAPGSTPAARKERASSAAQGVRRQARKDAR